MLKHSRVAVELGFRGNGLCWGTRRPDRERREAARGLPIVTGVFQKTLQHAVECTGVGIHSGAPARMAIKPARPGAGIVFKRTDVKGRMGMIPARFDLVSETRLGTTLVNGSGIKVAVIEHLMAALAGMNIDNAVVEVNGPELPIMDGSAAPFAELIEAAGVKSQLAPRRAIRVLKRATVRDGQKQAEFVPGRTFMVEVDIDFESRAIRRQRFSFDVFGVGFAEEVAAARTFGFRQDVESLKANGFARCGSLDNSVVVDGERVLNDGGLRYSDEFARHKLLDAIGDLYLAGAPIVGHFRGLRSGHTLNNALLRALFADATAYEIVALGAEARTPQPAAQMPIGGVAIA